MGLSGPGGRRGRAGVSFPAGPRAPGWLRTPTQLPADAVTALSHPPPPPRRLILL